MDIIDKYKDSLKNKPKDPIYHKNGLLIDENLKFSSKGISILNRYFCFTDSFESLYSGGIFYFSNLTADNLRFLVDAGFVNLEESQQDDSPTIKEFLDFANSVSEQCNVSFHGYAVSPKRSDYRITLRCIEMRNSTEGERMSFINKFKYADSFINEGNYLEAYWD